MARRTPVEGEAETTPQPEELVIEVRVPLPENIFDRADIIAEMRTGVDTLTGDLAEIPSATITTRIVRRRTGKADETAPSEG